MAKTLGQRFTNWKASPRRWDPSHIAAGTRSLIADYLKGAQGSDQALLTPPIEVEETAILADPEFCASIDEVKDFTCQDIARLANLWMLIRQCGAGTYLEVGSYKGGTALHICNAMPQAGSAFHSVDPFELGNFEIVADHERAFGDAEFKDTRKADVEKLLAHKPFARVTQGFFPAAAESLNLANIVFCHLDVDMQHATLQSLRYIAPRLAHNGVIVVDDFHHRDLPGVALAVDEFLREQPRFRAFPMFPCQALLVQITA